MALFYSKDFEGIWGVGVAGVVEGKTMEDARTIFKEELRKQGLNPDCDFTLIPLKLKNSAIIINNGDY